MSKPLTDTQREQIHELRSYGFTQKQIAEKIGRCLQTVQHVLNPDYRTKTLASHQRSVARYPIQRILSAAKSRAINQGVPFDLTIENCPPFTDNCPKCGVQYQSGIGTLSMTSRSLDKIIPCNGYVEGNVIWLCFRCNKLKSDMTLEDFRSWVEFLEGQI